MFVTHVINQTVSINEELDLLCAMVFHNPNVRSCFLNVINSCLQNEFQATENGSRVKKALMNKLRHPYSQFFRNAITNGTIQMQSAKDITEHAASAA